MGLVRGNRERSTVLIEGALVKVQQMRILLVVVGTFAVFSLQSAQGQREGSAIEWATFSEERFGTRVQYPVDVFTHAEGQSERGHGRQFRTTDGRATLAIYSLPNETRDTPASFLRKNLRTPRSTLHYRRVTPAFFAISRVHEGTIFYSRCNFSVGAAHCFDLQYPEREKRAWDAVVTRISLSLRPLQRLSSN